MRNLIFIGIEVVIFILIVVSKYYTHWFNSLLEEYPELQLFANLVFYIILVDFARRILIYSYKKRKKIPSNKKDNFHFGINNLAKVAVGLGLIVSLFGLFGIDIMTLLTSLSIVAAAIAIITKEYINDFLVGLYFSFSKDFEINDYVRFGEHKGKIFELQMLKIKILNDDDDIVIIPNGKIYNNEIINYTKRDVRSMNIDFQIDINAVKNIASLEEELIESLKEFEEFIESNSFNLKIVNMKKDYIDMKFQYTLKKTDRELQRKIKSKTVRKVFNSISEKKSLSKS